MTTHNYHTGKLRVVKRKRKDGTAPLVKGPFTFTRKAKKK